MCTADGRVFGSVAEALRMTRAGLDYLNGPGAAELDAAACGLALRSLGEIEATFTAAHAAVLARFDAADAHDSDGYGTSAAWLIAMADMTRPDAKTKVWRMRLLRDHPEMADALANADISKSQALAIAGWTRTASSRPAARGDRSRSSCGAAVARRRRWRTSRILAGTRAWQTWRARQPRPRRRPGRTVRRPLRPGRHHIPAPGHHPRQPDPRMRRRRAGGTGGARQEGEGRRGCPHRRPAVPRRAAAGLRAADRREDGAGPGRRGHPPSSWCTPGWNSCASTPKRQQPRRCGCAAQQASPVLQGKDAEAAACGTRSLSRW